MKDQRIRRTIAVPFIAALSALISGCDKESSSPAPAPEVRAEPKPNPPKKPTFTKDQWLGALRSSFEATESKTDEEGVTRYTACFRKAADGKCALPVRGKRDGFRRLDHLTPVRTLTNQAVGDGSYIGIYITASECEAPSIMVAPEVNGKNGWIFMSEVALMADGAVVLKRSFEHNDVERDNDAYRIRERGTFIATDVERDALKTFASAQSPIVRITGQKGYITLDKRRTNDLVSDAKVVLEVMNKLESALGSAGGPKCDGG